MDDDALKIK